MKNDFILDEAEFSIAVNKISNLSLALVESLDSYVQILSDIQADGIKDSMICAELQAIIYLAKSYREDILEVNEQLASQIINPEIKDAESYDNFAFPSDFMTEVTYMLSRFL